MASTREWVSIPGVLRGEAGDETRCAVRALRVGLVGTGVFSYARCSIEHVEGPLPEGRYEVRFADQVNAVQLRDGHWLQA